MAQGKTYVKIASQTASGSVSAFTFSNIPQNFTDLVIITATTAASANTNTKHTVRVNGDSGSSYYTTAIDGSGSAAESWGQSAYTSADLTNYGASTYSTTSTITSIVNLMNYSNATTKKLLLSRFNSASGEVTATVALWNNTSPITSVTLNCPTSWASGSTCTLYGIEAAKTPKATGGDLIVSDGTYWYHAFKNSGSFFPNTALTADFLMIGGGGSGGGGFAGGGGGAGGHLYTSGSSLTANTLYPVVVGAGGSAASFTANNGSSSTFNSVTAYGGGQGGGSFTANAPTGTFGSGGGASGLNLVGNGAPGTAGQGNRGGNNTSGAYTSPYGAQGGGGAGAAGGDISTGANATNGGVGSATYSSWGLLTGTGQNISGTVYFSGGGGGGAGGNSGGTTGGSGGGGNGGAGNAATTYAVVAPTSGLAFTGGGGGGGGFYQNPGFGGSGVVIVRYPV